MENKSEKFQQNKFTSYGGDKGNEFKSDWPAKEDEEFVNRWVDADGELATRPGIWNGIAYKWEDVSSQDSVDKLTDGKYKEACQAVWDDKNKDYQEKTMENKSETPENELRWVDENGRASGPGRTNGLSCKKLDDTIHLLSFEIQAKYWKEKYKALKEDYQDFAQVENMIDIETGD